MASKPQTPKSLLKGVYRLNPTKMVMKPGSREARAAATKKATSPKIGKVKKGK